MQKIAVKVVKKEDKIKEEQEGKRIKKQKINIRRGQAERVAEKIKNKRKKKQESKKEIQ